LIARIVSFIQRKQLLSPEDTLIAAVSGGLDSTVMLYCLQQIKKELGIRLEVVHVNHGVRGLAAKEDQEFVEALCRRFNLPLHLFHLEGFDQHSSEEALRQARYEKFELILREQPAAKIATAHNLDDQIETVLMRLARGSRLHGLGGIPVKRGAFIRPLLFLRRAELESFAREHNLSFRVDESNQDMSKTRNRIRRQLLPLLVEVFGEFFYEGFAASLEDIHAANEWMRQEVLRLHASLCTDGEGGFAVNRKLFNALPDKLKHLFLESCVSRFYPLNFGIPSGYFQQFDLFVKNASVGRRFYFANSLCVIKNRTTLFFTDRIKAQDVQWELYEGQVVYIGRNKLSMNAVEDTEIELTREKNREFICGDRLQFPLTVRFWKKGDFFYPLGLKKRQKLSDFFINEKVNLSNKNEIPLVLNKDEIVWIAGMRLDARYRLQQSCRTYYELKWDQL
jgi:tRNA(Ile)-lysidine synthase